VKAATPVPPGSCQVTAWMPAGTDDDSSPSTGTEKAEPHGTMSCVPSSTMICPSGPDDRAVMTTRVQPMYRAPESPLTRAVQFPPVVTRLETSANA
jgi:hypothetical protein